LSLDNIHYSFQLGVRYCVGFTSDELLGKQVDFVPQENWPETQKAIENMLSGQKIHLFETKRLTQDGRVLDVQISSTLYLDRKGEPVGNIVTLRDISAQKSAEILCLSKNTIMFHRYNIRCKLGLKNKKINLRSHLLSKDI
jgi:PAS domain S-box-containing protein